KMVLGVDELRLAGEPQVESSFPNPLAEGLRHRRHNIMSGRQRTFPPAASRQRARMSRRRRECAHKLFAGSSREPEARVSRSVRMGNPLAPRSMKKRVKHLRLSEHCSGRGKVAGEIYEDSRRTK